MLSKLQLSCRVSPSDRGRPIRPAWTEDSSSDSSSRIHNDALLKKQGKTSVIAALSFSSSSSLSSQLDSLRCSLDSAIYPCALFDSGSKSSLTSEFIPVCSSAGSSIPVVPFPLSSPSDIVHRCPKDRRSSCELSSPSSSFLSSSSAELTFEYSLNSSSLSSSSSSVHQDATLPFPYLRPSVSPTFQVVQKEDLARHTPTRIAVSATTDSIKTTCSLQRIPKSRYTLVFTRLGQADFTGVSSQHFSVSFEKNLCEQGQKNRSEPFTHDRCFQRCALISKYDVSVDPNIHAYCENTKVSFCVGSFPSVSADSDSEAHIDSMSSSDLDQCEDLKSFELAQNSQDLSNHDCHNSRDLSMLGKDDSDRISLDQSFNGNDLHVMNFREFEQLPPFSEGCPELPIMWEDGGALGIGNVKDGFSIGRSGAEESLAQEGQWSVLREDSVRIFTEDGLPADDERNSEHEEYQVTLEQRSTLIEQTLSEIYESPFQKLIYAPVPASPKLKPSSRSQQRKTTSFQLPSADDGSDCDHEDDINGGDNLGDSIATWASQTDDNGRGIVFQEEEEDARVMGEKQTVKSDADSSMKASIARAAQRAVSGYRSCEDADNYVGARVKPKLILARAPPSPSGILRRTNKKTTTTKVVHGNVHWADGRATSLQPPEDATTET